MRILPSLALILTLAGAVALAPSAISAAEGGGNKPAQPANSFLGTISKINTTGNTVTVEGSGGGEKKGATRVFAVDASTVVTISGAKATINDLKVGQQVQVTHTPVDLAQTIEVKPATAAKKHG